MESITILNYQGNKTSLMPFIASNIEKYISPGEIICDIFSGSGSVGMYLKDNYSIIANDVELFSSIISDALLNIPKFDDLTNIKNEFMFLYSINIQNLSSKHNETIFRERKYISTKETEKLIELYSSFPTIWNNIDSSINFQSLREDNNYNLFLYYYSCTYFSIEQSITIDAIIKTIFELNSSVTNSVLFSCLFYSMKETVFSKDGHMAQPLSIEKNTERHIKQRSKNLLQFFIYKLDEFIEVSKTSKSIKKHFTYNYEMSELIKSENFKDSNIKMIYADPPYTDMQYSRYYHLLNVAVLYNYPEPTIINNKHTKGLYTEGRFQSELSRKKSAKLKLEELIDYCYSNNIMLMISYAYPKNTNEQMTDRYTISIEELITLAKSKFGNEKVHIEYTEYQHANHRNKDTKKVFEYLIICGSKTNDSYYDIVGLKNNLKNLIPTTNNPIYNTHLYWSQKSFNVIDSLISYLSKDGDIIFDPFMGSGVSIIESVKNNRNRIGIGCDINDMPKFIVDNILYTIPNSDLHKIFTDFNNFLESLNHYYETECPACKRNGIISKVVFDKPIRTENSFNIKSISYICKECGKLSKEPSNMDYQKISNLKCNMHVPNRKLLQNSKIAVGISDTISDLFTPRNFSILNEIVFYIANSESKNLLNYLLMSVLHLSKITDLHSNSQWPLWIPKINCVEKNIITLLRKNMKNIIVANNFITKNYSKSKSVTSFDKLEKCSYLILTKGSQFINDNEIPDNTVSLIITDPPYMDQVYYSEYMQLYEPFVGLEYNLKDEIIVTSNSNRKRDKYEYFSLLNDVFSLCSRKLKENHFMCLFFHDSNLDVWVKLIDILENNGFRFISQEHIKKTKTVKNILSPKKSLSGDAVLFFENTRRKLPVTNTSLTTSEIEFYVYLESKKLLEKFGDLSTPELYDLGIMEMLIENSWLYKISTKYKSLVEIFEKHFIWKAEKSKWHLQQ